MTSPDEQPPRRPFEHLRDIEPEPFHRSQEFQRILWLSGLVVFLGLFALYFLRSQGERALTPDDAGPAAMANAAVPPSTPEDLAARRDRIGSLFEGALGDSANGDSFAETAGYRRLLSLVASYTPEDFRSKVTRWLDYPSAVAEPDLWRGEFVRARGLISWMGAERLARPALGIEDVWRGALTGADGEEALIIDLVNPPPTFEKRREVVDVEGIFYRTVEYETVGVRGVVEVPYLIARNFRVVDTATKRPASFLHDNMAATLVGMAVAFGLTRLLMYWFQRKNRMRRPARTARKAATDFHAMFEKHRLSDDRRSGPRPPA